MKLTKKCLFPWSFMQFHAGGMMQPCAVGADTDMGDFIIDYLEKKERGIECDFLNNEGLQRLRKGMLSGNLRPMCQNCFFFSNELQTTQEFEKQLKEYLHRKLKEEVRLEDIDLTKIYAYDWMAISFTNKCNLSCVYCIQSVLKDSNPYLKAEIPYKYTESLLDLVVSKGISRLTTCVEGEATLYRYWYEVFSTFHKKYPQVQLWMTTNLNRKFSEKEIELLANYSVLDISIDSLKPELFSMLRRNGNLELLLQNLDSIDNKVKELGIPGPTITLHMVISDRTWMEIEEVSEFAFARGYGIQLGNYEERMNTVAYQTGMLKPIETLSSEEQNQVRDIIARVEERALREGRKYIAQGDIFKKVNKNVEQIYHRFTITDHNPVYEEYLKMNPKGTKSNHFSIVYDKDNISYAGIELKEGEELCLTQLPKNLNLVYRIVNIYKEGQISPKYKHRIEPGYRKTIKLEDGIFRYPAAIYNDNIESILIDISETWLS